MNEANGATRGAVFLQTNEPIANRLAVFQRDSEGRLSDPEMMVTGGRGDGRPHLPSQGSVVLTRDRTRLLVTNAGSDDVSVFDVGSDVSLLETIASGGAAPKSVAEHAGLVYVLNTGDPSLVGFRLGERLEPIAGSRRELAADADPAQVGFSPDGSTLIVTDRGTDAIVAYAVESDGRLGAPRLVASAGPTPYGFAFAREETLVVTEAFGAARGKAAASSYAFSPEQIAPVSPSVANGRSEICWAVATNDGHYVFTTNFADGAVSRYAVAADGTLTLDDPIAGTATDGEPGLRDEDLTDDGRFLYAVDADGRRVLGWAVDAAGNLEPIGSWNGLPGTVAGLAAR